jgi:hypothetical protein
MIKYSPRQLERDRWEIQTAQAILVNIMETDSVLEKFKEFLGGYYGLGVNSRGRRPRAAQLKVHQDLRRSVQRVVSHHIKRALFPYAFRVLESGPDLVEQIRKEGVLDLQEWRGARYRVFKGDEALIAAGYEHIFNTALRESLFEGLSPEELTKLLVTNRNLTRVVQDHADETREEETPLNPLTELLANEPYVGYDRPDGAASFRHRTISFLANSKADPRGRENNGLRPDLYDQLRANAVGFGEFYSSGYTTLAYAARRAGCPPSEWLATALGSIAAFSGIAALKDKPADDTFCTNRMPPAFKVVKLLDGHWTIEIVRQPLAAAVEKVRSAAALKMGRTESHEGWGRCPATGVLASALPEEAESDRALCKLVDEITGGRCPTHLRQVVTPSDVCAVIGIGWAEQLRRSGQIKLDPGVLSPIERREPEDLRNQLEEALEAGCWGPTSQPEPRPKPQPPAASW